MDGRRVTCIERHAAPFHPSRKPKAPVLRKQNTGHGQALSTVLDRCACLALREHGNNGQAGGSLGRPRSPSARKHPAAGQGRTVTGRYRSGWLAPARISVIWGGGYICTYIGVLKVLELQERNIPRFSQVNMSFETPGQPACGSTCAHAIRTCRCFHVLEGLPCAAHVRRCRTLMPLACHRMLRPMSGMSSDVRTGG